MPGPSAFPLGETQSVSVFGEIGSHIQDRGQEVPGSAGSVRGFHLTPCRYCTLIITTAVTGDPDSDGLQGTSNECVHTLNVCADFNHSVEAEFFFEVYLFFSVVCCFLCENL